MTHFYQIGEISIILYELPEKSFKRKAKSSLVGRSLKPYDQRLCDRYVLKPHVCYVGPAGVNTHKTYKRKAYTLIYPIPLYRPSSPEMPRRKRCVEPHLFSAPKLMCHTIPYLRHETS
ncbi:hypothetical protein CDAR_539631 [Caerostris darwini]|uniref:Uncharacterized protein n=1 Tax=Caerostris darwini TaxID=1538125 RepID=A0AAV4MWU0_9ARAC|nr:hypothetical protein CDAR_539631 [Caerostris darwini]